MAITRSYQSPNQVTYDDLIVNAQMQLTKMLLAGRGSWERQHQIAVQQKTVALLKKFKKEPQGNLFEMFKTLK